MGRHYTGVGARETPVRVLAAMQRIGARMAAEGYTLRSGGAPGADTAFEQGAGPGASIIYLQWPDFRGHRSPYCNVSEGALAIAAQHRPEWSQLSRREKALHGRNVYQVLGLDLKSKTDFVICWTQGAKLHGGTGMAIRLAQAYSVPVYNLAAWSEDAVLRRVLA